MLRGNGIHGRILCECQRILPGAGVSVGPQDQLRDPEFAERFKRAGEAWEVALQIAALREKAGLSQKDLARKLKTSQQQISRLESPGYEGHSLSMLRRVAKALHAHVRVVFEAEDKTSALAEEAIPYKAKRGAAKLA